MRAKDDGMISVVICTLDRPNLLLGVVRDLLEGQSYRNFEIIIVDQGDRSNLALFEGLPDPEKIKYLRVREKGPPNARNTGIRNAAGGIILFLDDDVSLKLQRDFLLFHLRAFRDKSVGCAAGRVIERVSLKNTSVPGAGVGLPGRVLANFESTKRQYVKSAMGANMSFSREAVDKTGYFDLMYAGPAFLEETDYCYRMGAAGYRVLYEPLAVVIHLKAAGGTRQYAALESLRHRFHNTAYFYCRNMNKCFLPFAFAAHAVIALKHVIHLRRGLKGWLFLLEGFFRGILACANSPSEYGPRPGPQRIGIDCTSLARRRTGIENYTLHLLENILKQDGGGTYTIFFRGSVPRAFEKYRAGNEFVPLPDRGQFFCEQFQIPLAAVLSGVDFMFFPAFPPGLLTLKPFIVTAHDASPWKCGRHISWKTRFYFKPLLSIAVRRARGIITVSNFSKGEIEGLWPEYGSKLINASGAAGPAFRVADDRVRSERVRNKYGLPGRFILHAGSIEPRKNLVFLLRAFKKAGEKYGMEDYALLLAGRKAWGAKRLLREISMLGIEERVHVAGYVPDEDLVFLYNLARLLVFPSVYEGFGLPVLEAMACGCPVIASDTPVNRELFGGGVLLADSADEDGFALAIRECAENGELRSRLKTEGLSRSKMFSWEKTASKTIQAFRSLG